jgi:toxin-antitoxin system PIN domain toxin
VIAVDTNILVYAHRREIPQYSAAYRSIGSLAGGDESWGIPWPCVHEFLAVVTNRRAFRSPSTLAEAVSQTEAWFASPTLRILEETPEHWSVLREVLERARATGGLVHDARIATLCIEHGVRELWTADRDFSRFEGFATFNPLIDDRVHETPPTYGAVLRARATGRRREIARRATSAPAD